MAKPVADPAPATPPAKSDEDEVYEAFGITEDDDKHRVRMLAASRVLAAKKLKPKEEPKPEPKTKKKLSWGEE